MLGPSAGSVDGEIATLLSSLAIPESCQPIFQSDAAALEEVQRVGGVTLAVGFAVGKGLAAGRAPARGHRAGQLHHDATLHPGDDPRRRCRRHPVPAQGSCHALELGRSASRARIRLAESHGPLCRTPLTKKVGVELRSMTSAS